MTELVTMILLGFSCVLIGVVRNWVNDASSKREDFLDIKLREQSKQKKVKTVKKQITEKKETPEYMKPLIAIFNEELKKFRKGK